MKRVVERRDRPRTDAEDDVFAGDGRFRRFYCYTQRPGVTAGIKRAARRRERRLRNAGAFDE